jgi:molybdopterin molybdotransferase
MLEYEEALARILAAVPPPTIETIHLADAAGRVIAERVLAPIHLPRFDNSSMDGFALRAADIAGATRGSPVRLGLTGRVAAGETLADEIKAGTCIRLFTGSPVPRGADAVLMQEDTQTDASEILCLEAVQPGENVRRKGEDVAEGAPLAEAGEVLLPCRLSVLAACGIGTVRAGCPPTVGVLASGSELIEPGEPLGPSQIYESNRVALAALMKRVGAKPQAMPIVPDSLAATRRALAECFAQCEVVVTSGGVSVGELDLVKRAFEEVGGQLQFWKVAIRPGRPFVFGRWGKKLLFGLPGNPVSALVTYLLLVRPALLRWQGAVEVAMPNYWGELAEPLSNPGERRHFVRVKLDRAGKIRSAGRQGSHMVSSMATANGLVDVPAQTTLASGAKVAAMSWE